MNPEDVGRLARRGWEMLAPLFELLDDDQRMRCQAHYGRVTGMLAAGVMDEAAYRNEITQSQRQARRTVRQNMGRQLPHLPGADTANTPTTTPGPVTSRRWFRRRAPERVGVPQWMRERRAAVANGGA